MSKKQTLSKRSVGISLAAALGLSLLSPLTAAAGEYDYTLIPQSQMTVVEVDSAELEQEGANGAKELILDGNENTYWHTKWKDGKDPLPHHVVVKLGENPIDSVGRIVLTPRQDSNGSGRVKDYEVYASHTDPTCGDEGAFKKVAHGSFDGEVAQYSIDRTIDFEPVTAQCLKLVYVSAWGGKDGSNPISLEEQVASLAEFNAYTAQATTPQPPPPAVTALEPRQGADDVVLTEGNLTVRLDRAFPQVNSYSLGGKTVLGSLREPLTHILIDETEQPVTVAEPVVAADSASYGLSFPNLPQVSMQAVFTVRDGGVLEFGLQNITDPNQSVHRIRIPNQDIVSLDQAVEGSALSAQVVSINRGVSGDQFEPLSEVKSANPEKLSYRVVANTDEVAVAFENNATEDSTAGGVSGSRVRGDSSRWSRSYREVENRYVGAVWSGTWTYRGAPATDALGPDQDPFWRIKLIEDANADGVVDWQDGAIAFRDIRRPSNGQAEVPNKVISRIPFNIVSQATHPFLRTLDDTKRISLATDGLGQQVLLKGYEAEGHDSAHPDYAGHYNTRAGGLDDLVTLVKEGEKWNANFGVHVNTTESYSESYNFSEDLIKMPPQAAWGWMNQAYYIDQGKDLGTGNVVKRFQDFRDELDSREAQNLDWLYIDVYYPNGWLGKRLGDELQSQGWKIASEWSDKFIEYSLWSHWSQEENYGGTTNKGWNSKIFRFMENSYRDQFNPDPILGNTNLVDFEGWTGHVNYNQFIRNVWERNLPTKFLQQSNIVRWENNRITFENGTVAESPDTTIAGNVTPTNRTITYGDAVVYRPGGTYLLPWTDGGPARLYHYNPGGGSTTWDLPAGWNDKTQFELFKLTDVGRVHIADLNAAAGKLTIPAVDASTAYVLYPSSTAPAVGNPDWGQGSGIKDPGFFSGTLNAYTTEGDVSIEKSDRGNFQALIGAGEASLAQELDLPAGSYSAWAWVEIEPGKQRSVSVSANGSGVTPAGYQTVADGIPTTTVRQSSAMNATASDEKLRKYFQRVRVTFTSTGSPVTFKIAAGNGDSEVRVDDLRVVPFIAPTDSKATPETIFFEDFEHVDTGYWPFVTGATNAGGDARTQLAERHAPYSQKGWWGKNKAGAVVEGGKLIDNVLEGAWSLMAHEENVGQILRTIDGSLPSFQSGHKYRISFDYQAAHEGGYAAYVSYDSATPQGVTTTEIDRQTLPEAHETSRFVSEFVAGGCGSYWLGIDKLSGGPQNDLVIDNLRVEDLGDTGEVPSCLNGKGVLQDNASHIKEATPTPFTTTVTNLEPGRILNVVQTLRLPEQWSATPEASAAVDLEPSTSGSAQWTLTAPEGAEAGVVTLVVDYQLELPDGTTESRQAEFPIEIPVIGGIRDGLNYVSDLPWDVVQNGWGPPERDMDNGEQPANDGPPIKIGSKEYRKGMGLHAKSDIRIDLENKCRSFRGVFGVQNGFSGPGRGTVTYTIYGDNQVIYGPTRTVTNSSPIEFDIDVTGVSTLRVYVDNAGDGNGGDHAVVADAAVICGTESVTIPEQADVVMTGDPQQPSVKQGGSFVLQARVFEPGPATAKLVTGSTEVNLGEVTIGENWRGEATFAVPEDFPVGQAQVVLTQGTTSATADLLVTEKPVVPVYNPQLQVTAGAPGMGVNETSPGGNLELSASGFIPNAEVTFFLGDTKLGSAVADDSGRATLAATVPADFPVGESTASATQVNPTGVAAELSASAKVVITKQKPVDPVTPGDPTVLKLVAVEGSVGLAPNEVYAGEHITLVAYGFEPDREVEFELHSLPVKLGVAVADKNGIARLRARVPSDVPAGWHTAWAIRGKDSVSTSIRVLLRGTPPSSVAPAPTGKTAVPVLSKTGSTAESLALLALGVIAVGSCAVVLRRRKYS